MVIIKRMTRHGLLLILLIGPIFATFSQSVKDVYDLDFEKIPKDKMRWSWLICAERVLFAIDSTAVNSENPLRVFSQDPSQSPYTHFELMRTIPLPEKSNEEAYAVTVRCMNESMKNLNFSVMYIDENEEVVFYDSAFISSPLWEEYSISSTKNGIKAVRIGLSSKNNKAWQPQQAWVDWIFISVGDKIINDHAIADLYPESFSELKKDYIIPLSIRDNENIQKIFHDKVDCRIMGLGESSHGSQEIKEANYQFMKVLITQFDYKIVLIERAADQTLKWDLYVRGLIPDTFENQIKEECNCYFDDYASIFDFLSWAREYNKTSETKIRLFGIDTFLNKQVCLFEYFTIITDQNNPNWSYYLKMLNEGQFQEVRRIVVNDTALKSRLGSADFNYLLFLLETEGVDLEKLFKSRGVSYDRDQNMWSMMEKIIDIYAPCNEKMIVHAHSDHVNKRLPFLMANLDALPLGNYINSKYSKEYFALSIQIAEGSYTQDENSIAGKTMIHELQPPPQISFEHKGLNTGLDYFYYPTDQLPQDVTHLRMLLRTGRYLDQFYFCSIKNRFDGLVFVKNSSSLNNIEDYPFFCVSGLLSRKQWAISKMLNKI